MVQKLLHVDDVVRAGTKGWKTAFKASSAKMSKTFEGLHVFLPMLLLIGYRKPPKLNYCFITSTSLTLCIPVTVSTWTEDASNTASTLMEHAHIISSLDCTSVHAQILK